MKKIQNAITRLKNCMGAPVIDCRELSRLIDELQHQTAVDDLDGLSIVKISQGIVRGGGRQYG